MKTLIPRPGAGSQNASERQGNLHQVTPEELILAVCKQAASSLLHVDTLQRGCCVANYHLDSVHHLLRVRGSRSSATYST